MAAITFEQGPIRPPSEAGSLLLRFTRNCPWNRCTFCPVYKGQKFSRRSLDEICHDIDAVKDILDDLRETASKLGFETTLSREPLRAILAFPDINSLYRHVALWAYAGKGTVFIQDANSLILDTGVLVKALKYLRSKIPFIRRVTSYSRSSTISRKSLEEMREIREAGLDQVHIGLESGSDRVLESVGKGVLASQHIDAGRKVIEAGMTLSEYVMPGLGGQDLSVEHAIETARVLNAIDPHYIRLRSLRVTRHAPLYEEMAKARFAPLSDDDTAREIRLFIDCLGSIHSTLTSDHAMNLLEEVEGILPDDKEKMIAVIDRYLAMGPEERILFRLGRRGGALKRLDDLNDPMVRQRLQTAMRDLAVHTGGDVEKLITELGDQYI